MLFRSIIGPKTRNASKEPLVNVEAKDRAKNESTVEQIETSPANSIMAKMEVTGPAPRLRITSGDCYLNYSGDRTSQD